MEPTKTKPTKSDTKIDPTNIELTKVERENIKLTKIDLIGNFT